MGPDNTRRVGLEGCCHPGCGTWGLEVLEDALAADGDDNGEDQSAVVVTSSCDSKVEALRRRRSVVTINHSPAGQISPAPKNRELEGPIDVAGPSLLQNSS